MAVEILVNSVTIHQSDEATELAFDVVLPLPLISDGDMTPRAHTILVGLEAIAYRQALYACGPLAALRAIFREHVKTLVMLPDGEENDQVGVDVGRLRRWGGLRRDVTVTVAPGLVQALRDMGLN